ncbi:MAG: hypothetical protein J5984_03475 [Clostridia bacterium]|nr:hypothetical protein [Clostridia bacterium]
MYKVIGTERFGVAVGSVEIKGLFFTEKEALAFIMWLEENEVLEEELKYVVRDYFFEKCM